MNRGGSPALQGKGGNSSLYRDGSPRNLVTRFFHGFLNPGGSDSFHTQVACQLFQANSVPAFSRLKAQKPAKSQNRHSVGMDEVQGEEPRIVQGVRICLGD